MQSQFKYIANALPKLGFAMPIRDQLSPTLDYFPRAIPVAIETSYRIHIRFDQCVFINQISHQKTGLTLDDSLANAPDIWDDHGQTSPENLQNHLGEPPKSAGIDKHISTSYGQ